MINKHCANCSTSFEITPDDLAFYEKVSPVFAGKKELIPPPTLCPSCRNQRRMAWRNDRSFYVRTCDLTKERFVSLYPQGSPFAVFKPSAWYGDGWDPMAFGRAFDFNRPFFDQFFELQRAVPRLGIDIVNCENSEYCNYCGDDKDCYLDIAGEGNRDCYYDLFTKYSTNCVDCTFVYSSERCYECINCYDSYECRFSQYLDNCSDCGFCFDLKGCRNCLFCINLRNKEYHILNRPRTKEEYEAKLKELRSGSYAALRQAFAIWKDMRLKRGIYRDMYVLNCERCVGNDIKNSKNCSDVYNVVHCEDCKHLNDVLDAKDCQDLNYSLYKPEASFELISTLQMQCAAFAMASHFCSAVFYCDLTNHSQDLFGCVGLTHKQDCILNTQYTKEEYAKLVPKIIEHMRKDGGGAPNQSLRSGSGQAMNRTSPSTPLRVNGASSGSWGEFFPMARSPFAYNETVAQEYFPLSEKDAQSRCLRWKQEPNGSPAASRVIPASALPDAIDDIPDDVLQWAIKSEGSGKPFKLIRQELAFYRSMHLPLPRFHPDDRHRHRTELRNSRRLWNRTCAKCKNPIATSYAPERPEIVVCEECYLKEVY